MDAEAIIDSIRLRLVAMADDSPYRFRNTTRRDANAYQKRSKVFVGYSREEVAESENRLEIPFPTVFRAYLLTMGKVRGELFCGSDVAGLDDFAKFRTIAEELACASGGRMALPKKAIVFLLHQGYTFVYLIGGRDFDRPVYQYIEAEPEPSVVAPGFAALLDAEVRPMEDTHRRLHKAGGYYLTVKGRSVTQSYPARSSGERPLDGPHRFKKR